MEWKNRLVKVSGTLLIMVFFINMIIQVNLRKQGIPAEEYLLYSRIGSFAVFSVAILCGLIQWKYGGLTGGQKLSWALVVVWVAVGLLVWYYAMKLYYLPALFLYAVASIVVTIMAFGLAADL